MDETIPQAAPKIDSPSAEQLETLFHQISSVALKLKQRASDLQIPEGLPQGAKLVLEVLLRNGPRTVPQIARIRSTSRQNIQVLVNRLERAGHAVLLQNPAHKRSPFVQLTESGRAAVLQVLEAEGGSAEPLMSQLSQAEVQAATELLGRLAGFLTQGKETLNPLHTEKPGGRQTETVASSEVRDLQRSKASNRYHRRKPRVDEVTTDLPVNLL